MKLTIDVDCIPDGLTNICQYTSLFNIIKPWKTKKETCESMKYETNKQKEIKK